MKASMSFWILDFSPSYVIHHFCPGLFYIPHQSLMEGSLIHITAKEFSYFLFWIFQGWHFGFGYGLSYSSRFLIAQTCAMLGLPVYYLQGQWSLLPTSLTYLTFKFIQTAKKMFQPKNQLQMTLTVVSNCPNFSSFFLFFFFLFPIFLISGTWLCTSFLLCTSSFFGLANLWISSSWFHCHQSPA